MTFVYLPAQILPDLVAMERQGFTPAQVKKGATATDPKRKELKTTLCSLWECTLKKLLATDTSECRTAEAAH